MGSILTTAEGPMLLTIRTCKVNLLNIRGREEKQDRKKCMLS
jgi:hypothetical protein